MLSKICGLGTLEEQNKNHATATSCSLLFVTWGGPRGCEFPNLSDHLEWRSHWGEWAFGRRGAAEEFELTLQCFTFPGIEALYDNVPVQTSGFPHPWWVQGVLNPQKSRLNIYKKTHYDGAIYHDVELNLNLQSDLW